MPLSEKKIKEILHKYREDFDEMALYDETREILWGRERIDITLNKKIIRKLKLMRDKTGKSISRIIEESIEKI